MSDLTRRGFLRTASIGAAAIGALSALPSLVRAQEASPMPSQMLHTPGPGQAATLAAPASVTAPVVVFFDDLSSGKGRLFFGEQAIDFDNSALVQSVEALLG